MMFFQILVTAAVGVVVGNKINTASSPTLVRTRVNYSLFIPTLKYSEEQDVKCYRGTYQTEILLSVMIYTFHLFHLCHKQTFTFTLLTSHHCSAQRFSTVNILVQYRNIYWLCLKPYHFTSLLFCESEL